MTTSGDVIYGGSSGTPTRLAIGSSAQVLTVSGGVPAWVNASSGFSNPMTTKGDIIYEDGTPAPNRLPVGSSGQVLTVVSGLPAWGAASAASITYGTIASLPSVPASGTIYICTDCGYTFLSNGSAWLAYYNGWPVSRPVIGNFSWVAQGSATASTSTGPLVLHQPHTGNDTLASQILTPPSTPYTYTIGFSALLPSLNFTQTGLIIRDSSTGKCIVLSLFNGVGSSSSGTTQIQIVRYTQPSSGAATFNSTTLSWPYMATGNTFLRIYNDGTNLNYYVGNTPFDFELLLTESKSAWIGTINQAGIYADCNTSTFFVDMNCFHFVQT
jgi:hypothetical protein